MKKSFLLISNFLLFAFYLQAQPSFIKDSLDNYIKEGMKDWNIPGLAIAIVEDGKIVMMKGYGLQNIQTKKPVDENTLFMIASNTKLFTGTALAQLEYNKKLSLNDKITKYFPDYTLYDKTSTDLVTIRDMLSHHLGTKTFQGDFTFWNSALTREQIMNKMRLLKPVQNFRQGFGYCNSCFLTAGQIIPIVTGKPWEVYIHDSILMPLQMHNTYTLTQGMQERANIATPYTNAFSKALAELSYDHIDNLAPATSMVSCVKDLAHWLMMQLDSGRYEGNCIIPWAVIQKTRDANTIVNSRKASTIPSHFELYGLGVFISDYNGKQVFYHTGGADGFVTNVCFVPEEKLGITILTNNDNQSFFELLRYQILDAYLGVHYINRSKKNVPAFIKYRTEILNKLDALKARIKNNQPTLSLASYVGNYENELYGPITITPNKNELVITFKGHNNLNAKLQYMDNDEWLMTYNNPAYGIFPIKFKIENNKIISVDIKATDFLEFDPYTFIKK